MSGAGSCSGWLGAGYRRHGGRARSRRGGSVEDAVLGEVIEICKHFGARVVTDQFRAPAVVERLRRAGLTVQVEAMTATSKTLAYQELRARLAAGELELYRQPDLLAELRRLRSKFAAGHATVVNPHVGDSHGDVAQSLALGVWGQRSWRRDGMRASISRPSGRMPALGSLGTVAVEQRIREAFGGQVQIFDASRRRR